MLVLEDMCLSFVNSCLVYLQNFSEFCFGNNCLYFYSKAEAHYLLIITKQEDISCKDKIARGKKGDVIRIVLRSY